MAESKTKVRAPNPPIEQGGSQDGLPQPTVGAVFRVRQQLLTPRPKGERTLVVGQSKPFDPTSATDESTRIAAYIASQGITNPTFEDIEAAREQVQHQIVTTGVSIPNLPQPGSGEPGVTSHTRDILQTAGGDKATGPSPAQVQTAATKVAVEPPKDESKPPKDFDYKVDLPYDAPTAAQVLNYMPPEFRGIHAATDVNGRPIEGEWVDAKGEHLDPALEQKYEDYLTKREIALQVWNSHLAFIQSQAGADAQSQRDLSRINAQEKYKADLQATTDSLQRDFDREQKNLDRAISQGNLTETIRANKALEALNEKRFGLEKTQLGFSMMATIAANPSLIFFMKQTGLFKTLSEQFGIDFSMFDYGGDTPLNKIPFTLSDLARMSPSERKAAIGKVQAATGMSEADIMDALRRSAPGGSQGQLQRETL